MTSLFGTRIGVNIRQQIIYLNRQKWMTLPRLLSTTGSNDINFLQGHPVLNVELSGRLKRCYLGHAVVLSAQRSFSVQRMKYDSNSDSGDSLSDEDDDTEESDDEWVNEYEELGEDEHLRKFKHKVKEFVCTSARIDNVMRAAFSLGTKKVALYYEEGRIFLNDDRVRKAKKVKAGDCVDIVITDHEDDTKETVKRARILSVDERIKGKSRADIKARVWQDGFPSSYA